MRKFLVMALVAVATPLSAQVQPAISPAAPGKAKTADRVICRSMEETGSRLARRRVCMTKNQWDEQTKLDREGVEEAQRRSNMPRSQ